MIHIPSDEFLYINIGGSKIENADKGNFYAFFVYIVCTEIDHFQSSAVQEMCSVKRRSNVPITAAAAVGLLIATTSAIHLPLFSARKRKVTDRRFITR
ncbi:MAG: hypothetical protein JXA18_02360 [Chitinispirillaceae bacterium]|nr:hypothetical protein [Chitinispirillaceae bacterium]